MNKNTVLIRCDASARVGYGHLVRCLALAEAMRDSGRWEVVFAIAEDQGGVEAARARGFKVEHLRGNSGDELDSASEARWLNLLIERHNASLLVLDIRTNLSAAAVKSIRYTGVKIAVIDDSSERRLSSDIAFYPPVPQLAKLNWDGYEGQIKTGWEWILMPPTFAAERAHKDVATETCEPTPGLESTNQVLITIGGSDPAGLTLGVVRAIDTMVEDFNVTIVIGKAFSYENELKNLLNSASRTYELVRDPPSMAAVMRNADIAIASFGATAYELAAMGVPTMYLCLSEDHSQSATALANAGAAMNLGIHSRVNPSQIQNALREWLIEPQIRKQAGNTAQKLVDGAGIYRVAGALEKLFESVDTIAC
jgi:spore coat polysaccharide biosynthesis predicted glycosyltransferase SpsG